MAETLVTETGFNVYFTPNEVDGFLYKLGHFINLDDPEWLVTLFVELKRYNGGRSVYGG